MTLPDLFSWILYRSQFVLITYYSKIWYLNTDFLDVGGEYFQKRVEFFFNVEWFSRTSQKSGYFLTVPLIYNINPYSAVTESE